MTGYADAELLVGRWLEERLALKAYMDPILPSNWPFTSPIAHVQRGQDQGDTQLTLDVALLDIDVYAAKPDVARSTAELIRSAIRLDLPHYTWPTGVTCSSTETVMAPVWLPDPKYSRRSASYRVILHGMVT